MKLQHTCYVTTVACCRSVVIMAGCHAVIILDYMLDVAMNSGQRSPLTVRMSLMPVQEVCLTCILSPHVLKNNWQLKLHMWKCVLICLLWRLATSCFPHCYPGSALAAVGQSSVEDGCMCCFYSLPDQVDWSGGALKVKEAVINRRWWGSCLYEES